MLCFLSTDTFVDRLFVEVTLSKNFCRKSFCRKAFRRQDISSTQHFVDKAFCRHSTLSTVVYEKSVNYNIIILSTKCSVDEMSCRRNAFRRKFFDKMSCRRNVLSTKCLPTKICRQNASTKFLSTKCFSTKVSFDE